MLLRQFQKSLVQRLSIMASGLMGVTYRQSKRI